jgi:hypothetical protein
MDLRQDVGHEVMLLEDTVHVCRIGADFGGQVLELLLDRDDARLDLQQALIHGAQIRQLGGIAARPSHHGLTPYAYSVDYNALPKKEQEENIHDYRPGSESEHAAVRWLVVPLALIALLLIVGRMIDDETVRAVAKLLITGARP